MTGVISRVAVLFRQTAKLGTMGFAIAFLTPALAAREAKTTYDLSGTSTRARTEYKKAPLDLDNNLNDKLWERFSDKLKEMPFVTDVQIGEVTETNDDTGSHTS